MTALSHTSRRKLSLLTLATELQNVSKASRIMGSRRERLALHAMRGRRKDGAAA